MTQDGHPNRAEQCVSGTSRQQEEKVAYLSEAWLQKVVSAGANGRCTQCWGTHVGDSVHNHGGVDGPSRRVDDMNSGGDGLRLPCAPSWILVAQRASYVETHLQLPGKEWFLS